MRKELSVLVSNNSCLALVLKVSLTQLKPWRYTDGTSRVLPFPIPLPISNPSLLQSRDSATLYLDSNLASIPGRILEVHVTRGATGYNQGRIKEERACNLANTRIQMWAENVRMCMNEACNIIIIIMISQHTCILTKVT